MVLPGAFQLAADHLCGGWPHQNIHRRFSA